MHHEFTATAPSLEKQNSFLAPFTGVQSLRKMRLLLITKKEDRCPRKSGKNMQKFGGGQAETALMIAPGSCCVYARKVFA